jgi:hypothetical protein
VSDNGKYQKTGKNGIVPVFSDIDYPNGYGGYGKIYYYKLI